MSSSLGVATLAGLGGMIGWGFADFFAKKTIDRVGEVTTLFWSQLLGIVPLLAVLAVTRDVPAMHRLDPLWLGLLGVGGAAAYLLLYAGFGKGSMSVLSPVVASEAALTVLFSVVLFGERIAGFQWLAICVVLVGVLAMSTSAGDLAAALRGSSSGAMRGLPEVLMGAVGFAMWIVMLDQFIGTRDSVFFLVFIRAFAAAAVAVYARATGQSLWLPRGNRALIGQAAIVGLCDTAAFAAVSYGFAATTHTAIIAVLSGTFALPTMLLARVFLRERLGVTQKFAAATILAGVALVSLH